MVSALRCRQDFSIDYGSLRGAVGFLNDSNQLANHSTSGCGRGKLAVVMPRPKKPNENQLSKESSFDLSQISCIHNVKIKKFALVKASSFDLHIPDWS